MMKLGKQNKNGGFSLIELMIAMTITIILLGLVSTMFARVMGTRERESRRTDALTSAQAALNVMSREIANSGYGLNTNGIITNDSHKNRIHFRANVVNNDLVTTSPGEDLTYFYDTNTKSIVRYDAHGINATTPSLSVIVNRISDVQYEYYDYKGSSSTPSAPKTTPTSDTGRVRITITVNLEPVQGQPDNQFVKFTSDVTLRNSDYMLLQY
jgi:type II secretory pathway pseudopilin PulG